MMAVVTTTKTILMRRLSVQALVWLLVASAAIPAPLLASSFQDGYAKYSRGDLKGAETSFSQTVRTSKNKDELAKTYKFLGIVQFMEKKTALAQASFKAGLALSPSLSIDKDEVLDESVIPFFQRVKGAAAPSSGARTQSSPAKPAGKGAVSIDQKAKPNGTHLRINSNVATASILIDGILAGKVGSLLEVDPGVIDVQLDAPGFVSKRAKIRISANQENAVTLNLEKPTPKPKQAAPAEEKPTNGGGKVAALPKGKGAKPSKGKAKGFEFLPDPGADKLFGDSGGDDKPSAGGRDLQQEFAMDASSGGYTAQQQPPVQQPPYQQQPMYQPPYPQQQAYGQQPTYPPQPMYQYPTQPYAPGYPQPMYQQPYAQPYQQPYGYQQPYQQVAPPPAAPIQIPLDNLPPVSDVPSDASPNESFLPPAKRSKNKSGPTPIPYGPVRTKKKANTSGSSSSSSGSLFVTLLPFGAGQFQNGSYILGGLFATAEIGALYWWYQNKSDADAAVAAAEEYYKRDDVSEADKVDFADRTNAYVTKKRQQQQIGLYGFIGLWVVGIGEAYIDAPSPKAKPSKRKRRLAEVRLDDTHSSFFLADEDSNDDTELPYAVKSPSYLPRLSLGIMMKDNDLSPSANAEAQPPTPRTGLGLKAEWHF